MGNTTKPGKHLGKLSKHGLRYWRDMVNHGTKKKPENGHFLPDRTLAIFTLKNLCFFDHVTSTLTRCLVHPSSSISFATSWSCASLPDKSANKVAFTPVAQTCTWHTRLPKTTQSNKEFPAVDHTRNLASPIFQSENRSRTTRCRHPLIIRFTEMLNHSSPEGNARVSLDFFQAEFTTCSNHSQDNGRFAGAQVRVCTYLCIHLSGK